MSGFPKNVYEFIGNVFKFKILLLQATLRARLTNGWISFSIIQKV